MEMAGEVTAAGERGSGGAGEPSFAFPYRATADHK